jgi:vancomycin permeability regulator SanA
MNKRKIFKTIIFVVLIGCLTTLFINLYMIFSTKNQITDIDNLDDYYDAIIVLGCRVDGDSPSLMLSRRLDKGIEVYDKLKSKIILSGDHDEKDYDEVNVMRNYMLSSSVPSVDIFLDHAGINTYDSIYRAKYIFGAEKIVIVTQKYHMYRALYLANKLDLEAVGIVADDIPQKGIMLKNEIREVLSRDKNFFKGLIKPESKYMGEIIPLNQDGIVTEG